jgi:4a-hydroxytetrahydrobiopterin dehydratase
MPLISTSLTKFFYLNPKMWIERDNRLVREFRFKDFQEAFTFITRVAFIAEKMGHHPGIYNTFSYVRLELHTHDEGGLVTEKDRMFAREIDRVLA